MNFEETTPIKVPTTPDESGELSDRLEQFFLFKAHTPPNEANRHPDEPDPHPDKADLPDLSDQQARFLRSWRKSVVGQRPWRHRPTRGLRGIAVIAGSVAVVVGVVVGGIAVAKTVVTALSNGSDTTATAASPGEEGTASATSGSSTGGVFSTPTTSSGPNASPPRNPERPGQAAVVLPSGQTRTASEGVAPEGASKNGTSAGGGTSAEGGQPASQEQATKAGPAAAQIPGPAVATVGVIRNVMTGYCADLPGRDSAAENVLVTQYTCDPGSGDNQEFQTITQSDGTFLLRNVKSQWCLDVNGSGAVASGTVVNTHECLPGDSDNQMFRKEAEDGGFFLVNVKSGMCLNVSNPNGVDNKVLELRLTLYPCSTKDDHIWTFG